MDISGVHRADWERRRKIRLAQVRDQSKTLAKTIRDRVHGAVAIQLDQRETARNITEHKFKSLAVNKLKSDFNYLIQDIGNGYSVASVQQDANIVLAEKRLIDRCKAISRGAEADKRQQRIEEEQRMDKEMRDRRTHFNKTVEKIRSTLITSVQNVGKDNTHRQNIKEENECFFIPSQVTLNESNILNRNFNKTFSKPWSVVISSKENQKEKLEQLTTHDENKENVSKFSKLETDLKTYETLVLELNKLSAEEQNISNKLFPDNLKEIPVACQNNVPSEFKENNQKKEITRKKINTSSERTKFNETKKQITEIRLDESNASTSICISSSTSTSINNEQPSKKTIHFEKECKKKNLTSTKYEQPSKKTIHFEKESKKKIIQPSTKLNYKEKFASGKPLQNINNIMQRIKNKKQLLVKEISAGTSGNTGANIKQFKTVPPIPKILPIPKNCCAGNSLREEIPVNYAKLPDSFYNGQLDTLKKQISKKQFKVLDSKNNKSINEDLMAHINTLLKMSPSDVDNLSTSSCSSVKFEESVLQHSEKDTQYYCKMLNCISKCLNADISDINQDTVFDSPKNLLNKLQQLTNYYLEKTHEMKNICDETPQVLNYEINDACYKTNANTNKEKSSINLSSDSSVDGEYILGNLNKLLQEKGIINSDKEWPMFKHIDDDDDRSLTDQLLDIYPCSSYGQSCTCQKQFVQQYKGNKKNESPLQRPLENINEMLSWIKMKKRRLFDEIYTSQTPINDIQSMNSKSDTFRDLPKESLNYVGLPNSFYNSTLKLLEEYVKDKKQKKSKSNNNNNWINIELMRYICNLLKMSPNEIDNLSVSANSGIQLEQSILEISKSNLEYHKDILNYISKCLDSNLSDISRDQAFSSPQYIGLLDKLYKLADYYTEKAQEMRNICLESPRVEINSLDEDAVEQITEDNPSLTSELSVDGAYVLDHLRTLLEQRGLICADREWPIFGNDDEDDSRSLTDQLLDIKPQIKSKDIKVERSEKVFSFQNKKGTRRLPAFVQSDASQSGLEQSHAHAHKSATCPRDTLF